MNTALKEATSSLGDICNSPAFKSLQANSDAISNSINSPVLKAIKEVAIDLPKIELPNIEGVSEVSKSTSKVAEIFKDTNNPFNAIMGRQTCPSAK